MNLLAIVVALGQVVITAVPPANGPPDTPAAAPPPAPAPPKPKPPASIRFDGGYAPRKLFDIATAGADVGFAAGAQPLAHAAFWGTTRAFIGGTESGLRVWDVRVSGEAEYVQDRLRLGVGGGVFVLGVGRAARDETIVTWGPEGRVIGRFDVVRADDYALFVRGALGAG